MLPRGSTTPARPSPRRPRVEEEDEAGAGPSGLQRSASTSRVAPTPEQQAKERTAKKRKRSIQHLLNSRVMEVAETEARLGESKKEEDIYLKELQLYDNRREAVRLKRVIEEAKRSNVLQVISDNVQDAITRLNFAVETLEEDRARRIREVEDDFSREEATHLRDLDLIDAEEAATRNDHRTSIIDHEVFHARDVEAAGERLVEAIQASDREEMEDEMDDDISEEDDEDDDFSEDDDAQES